MSARAGAADKPLLVASGEFKPFTSSDYPTGGFLHDLVMQAFELSEQDAQALFLPWGRGFSGVQKHHFAATFPWVWSRQRDATFLYSKPLMVVYGGLYVRKGEVGKYRDVDDFAGMIFCLPKHFSSDFMKPFVGSLTLTLIRAADDTGCLEMLARGRVDATPVDILRAQQLMKNNDLVADAVTLLPWAVAPKTYHLIIDKSYPQAQLIIDQFDAGYDIVKSTKRWGNTLDKYGINPRWAVQGEKIIAPLEEHLSE